jgi:hypothetical protein
MVGLGPHQHFYSEPEPHTKDAAPQNCFTNFHCAFSRMVQYKQRRIASKMCVSRFESNVLPPYAFPMRYRLYIFQQTFHHSKTVSMAVL